MPTVLREQGSSRQPHRAQPWGCFPDARWRKLRNEHQIALTFHHYWPVLKNGDRGEKGSISHYQISNPPRKHLLNLGPCHGISSSVACCFIGCSQRCPVYHNAESLFGDVSTTSLRPPAPFLLKSVVAGFAFCLWRTT